MACCEVQSEMITLFYLKGEGTSYSAAIVSGIVALVLAFVHKDKGPDARAKISNNPVMKEILGKMATKRGQHDKVEGYGGLKPLRVFGHGAYILRNFVENLPSTTPFDAGDTKVSKFILSEASLPMTSLPMTPLPMTSLPMTSPQEQNSAPNSDELFEAESFDRYVHLSGFSAIVQAINVYLKMPSDKNLYSKITLKLKAIKRQLLIAKDTI